VDSQAVGVLGPNLVARIVGLTLMEFDVLDTNAPAAAARHSANQYADGTCLSAAVLLPPAPFDQVLVARDMGCSRLEQQRRQTRIRLDDAMPKHDAGAIGDRHRSAGSARGVLHDAAVEPDDGREIAARAVFRDLEVPQVVSE